MALLGASLLSASLQAQSTEADLKARLADRLVYLRGCWDSGKLHFDSSGKLLSKSSQVSTTLCGFDPKKVQLENNKLVLRGSRVGLAFVDNQLKPVNLDKSLQVEIDASSSGDYSPALDSIFAYHFADMVPLLPAYLQGYAQKGAQTTPSTQSVAPVDPNAEHPVKFNVKNPSGITPPVLIKSAEPEFSGLLRGIQYNGTVVVRLWIERDGTPSHLSIERPAGLGLDENALAAIQQYRFKPAMQNGKPVLVELKVEVNFQRY
ncbi:MAG TPA: energy transducer TonB [Edaphobacter sp.]